MPRALVSLPDYAIPTPRIEKNVGYPAPFLTPTYNGRMGEWGGWTFHTWGSHAQTWCYVFNLKQGTPGRSLGVVAFKQLPMQTQRRRIGEA